MEPTTPAENETQTTGSDIQQPPSTEAPSSPEVVSKEEYDQLATQFNDLRTAVAQYANQEMQKAQQQQTPRQAPTPIDPDTVITDPKAFIEQFQGQTRQQMQEMLNQVGQPILNSLSALAKDSASRDPKLGEVFKKYGSEIDSLAAQYPNANQHDVRFWHQVAKQIQAEHIDDIVKERVSKQVASVPRVETGQPSTDGFLSTAESSTLEKIKETQWGKSFFSEHEAAGRKLADMLSKTGMTMEQWLETVKDAPKPEVNPKNPGQWTTQVV